MNEETADRLKAAINESRAARGWPVPEEVVPAAEEPAADEPAESLRLADDDEEHQ